MNIIHNILGGLLGLIMMIGLMPLTMVTNGQTPEGLLPTPPEVFQNINNPEQTGALTGDNAGLEGNRNLINEGPITIMNLIFGLFTAIGIIIGIIAGIRLSFSFGKPEKMQESIMAIVYVAIGMIIIGASWMGVRLVLQINLGT